MFKLLSQAAQLAVAVGTAGLTFGIAKGLGDALKEPSPSFKGVVVGTFNGACNYCGQAWEAVIDVTCGTYNVIKHNVVEPLVAKAK